MYGIGEKSAAQPASGGAKVVVRLINPVCLYDSQLREATVAHKASKLPIAESSYCISISLLLAFPNNHYRIIISYSQRGTRRALISSNRSS